MTATALHQSYVALVYTRVAESEAKRPTPTFPKYPTPTPQHEGNEISMLKSMEVVVHSKKSVQTKVSKEFIPFQQEFPI